MRDFTLVSSHLKRRCTPWCRHAPQGLKLSVKSHRPGVRWGKKAKGLVQQLHRLTFTDRVESSGHAQPDRDLGECSSLPVNDLLPVKTFDQPLLGTLAAGLQK